jgi:hypothetical protein
MTMFWASLLKPFAAMVLLFIAAIIARIIWPLIPRGLRPTLSRRVNEDEFAYVRVLKRLDDRLISFLGAALARLTGRPNQPPPVRAGGSGHSPIANGSRRDS